MRWNDFAWQQHLTLSKKAQRYTSASDSPILMYWVGNETFALHRETADCIQLTLTDSETTAMLAGKMSTGDFAWMFN